MQKDDLSLKVPSLNIGKRRIGPGFPIYVIFEVASTHGNDWDMACEYVEQAIVAGADAVKFQLFTADKLINPITTGLRGTYDYFKTAEIPHEWFPKLEALCKQKGIDLLCTPFDSDSASFLDQVGVPSVKIASGELTNIPLLAHVATFSKPIIVSTGMATMSEVGHAVSTLRTNGAQEIALLQCVSVYPTSFEDANVSAMNTLAEKFNTVVGYSDNGSAGILVPLLAVARGASVIEKHVTSKKGRKSLDDVFSLSVEGFTDMVKRIRDIEKRIGKEKEAVLKELHHEYGKDFDKAIGDGIKRPAIHGTRKTHPGVTGTFIQKEGDERRWARRGIYPSRAIAKGTQITANMLVLLRPDIGISGIDYKETIGLIAGENIISGQPLKIIDRQIYNFTRVDIDERYQDSEDVQFKQMLNNSALFE